ncbi:unnamed protein product [Vitrella brassicaformis CCMP3155]|uniref:Uncharacterized protein n=1 Tax=Vitrella brassicaformis (strain CCMP3155) TaxID=1169540 RepID=A0A0G4GQE0_VITBC|nr:unnamed protein product [Vitrella brassicaformis CCMP3155]|eukprot:CEM32660.1 unnamed protein product [Vitrella brassicaformis CCMP3155]
MQPTGAATSSRPPSPALFQPADLFDLSLPISKMAAMAMAIDDTKRAALRSQIVTRTWQQELLGHTAETVNSTLLNGVQQHIDKAISRLGLADVLAFDIGDDLEAGLKAVYLLERGSGEEWRAMGAMAFHQMPLTIAIYKIIGHLLTHRGTSLALQQADNGSYHFGDEVTFRVVPLGEVPGGHRYADGYKRTDPVIRSELGGGTLYPSFSAFLLSSLLNWWCFGGVLVADIGLGHHRYGITEVRIALTTIGQQRIGQGHPLLTDGITEDQGIAVDYHYDGGDLNDADAHVHFRHVIVGGWRPGDTVSVYLWIRFGGIQLRTTERPAADRSHPLADRFPVSMPVWRRLLRRFDLESAVIDRGTVSGEE